MLKASPTDRLVAMYIRGRLQERRLEQPVTLHASLALCSAIALCDMHCPDFHLRQIKLSLELRLVIV